MEERAPYETPGREPGSHDRSSASGRGRQTREQAAHPIPERMPRRHDESTGFMRGPEFQERTPRGNPERGAKARDGSAGSVHGLRDKFPGNVGNGPQGREQKGSPRDGRTEERTRGMREQRTYE